MASNRRKDSTRKYMAEVIAAVAVCYFLLGGYAWSPATWALFAVVAIWIVIKNLRLDMGLESQMSYDRWRNRLGLLLVISFLTSPLWLNSWWPFLIGLVLGAEWLGDYRYLRELHRERSTLEPGKENTKAGVIT